MNTVMTGLPTRAEARTAAEQEYAALLVMLQGLDQSLWSAPTECSPWTVRDMVAHLNGAAEEAARLSVQIRHLRGARARVGQMSFVDALNEQQLADRRGAVPADLLTELTTLAVKAPKARMRTPLFLRRRPLPEAAGALPGDPLAYLLDVIYTRDIWMHRIDIARATGCDLPDSGAEPLVVAQVVRDLARAWPAEPIVLTLRGGVGGTWPIGSVDEITDPARIELDTVAACRVWSGRSDETGLDPKDKATMALLEARPLF